MAEEPADERGNVVLADTQDHDGVSAMTHVAPKEPKVTGEKRRPSEPAKLNNALFVLEPFAPLIHSSLPHWNAPRVQQEALAIENVFVQDYTKKAMSRAITFHFFPS